MAYNINIVPFGSSVQILLAAGDISFVPVHFVYRHRDDMRVLTYCLLLFFSDLVCELKFGRALLAKVSEMYTNLFRHIIYARVVYTCFIG